MSTSSNPHLDQAVDQLAFLISPTAVAYEDYLQGEYGINMKERWDSWRSHYLSMRAAFRDCLMSVLEERDVYRENMNVAIIGPGFEPVGRDFGEDDAIPIFRRLQSLVLCDISQRVCISARSAFATAAVPAQNIHAMQYDITNGLSTVCKEVVGAKITEVGTEEELSALTEELEGLEVQELDQLLLSEMTKIPSIRRPSLLEGGENTTRTWKLTVEGRPLPLHIVSYQMVLAGTLAHLMQVFRDRYEEVISAQEENDDKAIEQARRGMFRRLHSFIARFNTEIAVRSIRKILEDNPNATVLGITDVATVYEKPRFGEMAQLDVERLEKDLASPPDELRACGVPSIATRVLSSWSWHDEPEHHHRVNHIQFEVMREPRERHIINGT